MTVLPADGHVHSEFSWDALDGDMAATCARAAEIGLPALSFTEHVDVLPFRAGFLADRFGRYVRDSDLHPPPLDVAAYLEAVERCRGAHPQVTITTGMEVGQPHLMASDLDALLAAASFDRVVGSLHCLRDEDGVLAEPWALFPHRAAADVVRDYLVEIAVMCASPVRFDTLGHLDYPVRFWPDDVAPFDAADVEAELRAALRALAVSGRALELNTSLPLDPRIVGWWRDEGGRRVTFGSDAHDPTAVGRGLAEAAQVAGAHGFGPDRAPWLPWLA